MEFYISSRILTQKHAFLVLLLLFFVPVFLSKFIFNLEFLWLIWFASAFREVCGSSFHQLWKSILFVTILNKRSFTMCIYFGNRNKIEVKRSEEFKVEQGLKQGT